MSPDSIQAAIAHQVAELRAQHPAITECLSALVQWKDDAAVRYSLHLDIRMPQRQTIVSGPVEPSAQAAIESACRKARELISP